MSAETDAAPVNEATDSVTSDDESQSAASPRSRSPRSRSRSRLRRVVAEAEGVADLDVAADADISVLDLDATTEAVPQPEAISDADVDALPDIAAAPADAEPGASRRRRPGGRRNSRSSQPAASPAEPELAAAAPPATESETLEIATLIPGLDIDPQVLPGSDSTPDGDGGEIADAGSERSGASSRRSRRGGRRRRGGRDQAAEAAPATDADTDADLSVVSEEGDAPNEGVLELSSEDDSSLIAAIELQGSEGNGEGDTAAPAADDAAARRSRRSQRGGRRKNRAESEPGDNGTVAEVAQSAPADEFSLLPTVQARAQWTAPPLVPALDSALPPLDLGMQAGLDVPARGFVINGARVPANLFFVNSDPALLEGSDAGPLIPEIVSGEIRRAAQAGIHLHTCVAYLPLLNAYGERSFAAVDAAVQTVLDADPEAKLVLRVQCVPTNFWARTHEQEMASYADSSMGDVTIASAAFWADCVDALQALLAHLAEKNSPARGRVFALHLDKGEWFYEPGAGYDYSEANLQAFRNWLHQKYQTLYALRAAWFDGKVTFETATIPPAAPQSQSQSERRGDTVLLSQKRDRRVVDYVTYASSVVGSVVCGLAAAVKAITGGKLLVFVPYGYLFEFAARNDSGHQALTEVLACDSIDVLTGPNSYLTRAAGGVGGFAAPVDSLPLHNKLWIVEDDTKTYLAASDTPDSYNPKIGGQQETVMVLRRNFYAAVAHGCGLSWMDLWGQGWLDSDSVWDEIARMIADSEAIRQTGESDLPVYPERAPEVAVLVDDASYAWVRGDAAGRQLQSGLIVKARDLLQRSGASIGYYLQSDAGRLPESAKVVFFLNALSVTTTERQAIREKLQTAGKTLVWVYAPGLFDENGPAPSELTEIVGMPLKAQPWNSQVGTLFTDERHMITERLRGGKRMGTDEALNPSYAAIDPQATVLGVYTQSGEPSIAAKTLQADGAWRSVFIGEPQFTGELVRGILRYAGVHLYDTQDDIVFVRENPGVGGGLLVVHSPYTGQRVIQLPRPAACYNATEGRLVAQHSASVRLFLRGRSTQTFFWGDLEAVARQSGLNVDDLIATQAPQQRSGAENQGQERESGGESGDGGGDAHGSAPAYERSAGEAVEYPHDREYIVSSERMTTVEYTSVTSSSTTYEQPAAPNRADADSEIEPALEQVLRAVVEEVYSGAYGQPAEEDLSSSKPNASAAPDALRDARREASRITEALLADVSGDFKTSGSSSLYDDDADALDLPEGEQSQAVADGEQDGGAQAEDASGAQRSSSRRRRWRRKRQQGTETGASAADPGAQPPPAPKFSVEQIIGDLLRRRKPADPSE